jgi:hypothetical protein
MRIACFAMAFPSHFNGVMAATTELVQAGATVRVWTDKAFRAVIEAAGAQFADLFDPLTLADVDAESSRLGIRCVTFAGLRGGDVAAQATAFGADMVLYDSFALVGRAVAERLRVPYVILTPGHAVNGAKFRAAMEVDPAIVVGDRCWQAVARLREEFGITDASPFSHVPDPSPWLNIYPEPAEWVSAAEREFLDPLGFFGALQSDVLGGPMSTPGPANMRVYAAFGTIIWRYWPAEALQALEAIAESVGGIAGATLTIGLGDAKVDEDALARLRRQGAVVHRYADQWAALREADVFITHHGLGSTHEAVACTVPMLSLPFFWDQPALAKRAQELGLALPLIDGVMPGNRLAPGAVRRGLEQVMADRDAMRERLLVARQWEARTIETRPEIARQILALAR